MRDNLMHFTFQVDKGSKNKISKPSNWRWLNQRINEAVKHRIISEITATSLSFL